MRQCITDKKKGKVLNRLSLAVLTGFLVFYISLWHTFLQNPSFNEACFRDVLKLAMLTFNVTATTEVMGACGRADITAEAGDYLYVFELKVTDNSKDIATKLSEAKEQIIKNKYARRLTDKTVVPVALVLENNSKRREKTDTPVCEIVALEKVEG